MKVLRELIYLNLRLFYRDPAALFFAMVFPVLLLVFFGLVFGGESSIDKGFTYVEEAVPGFVVIVMATVGFLQIPGTFAIRREMRVLRAFKVTPLRAVTYIWADIIVNLLIVLCAMLLLSLVAWFAFGMRFLGNISATLLGMVFCSSAFFSFGYVIANLAATARSATAIGNLLFFPLMFLSGAAIPLGEMPQKVQAFAQVLPMTKAVSLMQGLWFGYPIEQLIPQVIYLTVVLIGSTFLAVVYFKWE